MGDLTATLSPPGRLRLLRPKILAVTRSDFFLAVGLGAAHKSTVDVSHILRGKQPQQQRRLKKSFHKQSIPGGAPLRWNTRFIPGQHYFERLLSRRKGPNFLQKTYKTRAPRSPEWLRYQVRMAPDAPHEQLDGSHVSCMRAVTLYTGAVPAKVSCRCGENASTLRIQIFCNVP